jgi:hypothetical protein
MQGTCISTVQPHWFRVGRICREATMVYFEALLWNVLEEADRNYENRQYGQPVTVPQHRRLIASFSQRSPWVHSQVSPCGICGEQNKNGKGLPPSPLVFSCHYHSTDDPY